MKIKIIFLVIVLNHLVGISMNFVVFLLSLMILIGIPILVYLLYFSIKLFKFTNNKNNNFDLFTATVIFLFYNLIIYIFIHEIESEIISEFSKNTSIAPSIFPLVNVALAILLILFLYQSKPKIES